MTENTRPVAELLAEARARKVSAKRAAFVAGLRKVADALEADPALPLPFDGTASGLSWYLHHDEAAGFAPLRALLGEDVTVQVDPRAKDYGLRLVGRIGGVLVDVGAYPEDVCEVAATRTVEVHDYLIDGQPIVVRS